MSRAPSIGSIFAFETGMNQAITLFKSLAQAFSPAAGGFLSQPDEWYQSLRKPPGNPPPPVFGPVWTVLYAMMGFALFHYRMKASPEQKPAGEVLFNLQLALNAAWTPVFFKAHSPRMALATLLLMWGAILATILEFRKVSGLAAGLLVPYFLWVSFAAYLNAGICYLNPEQK